MSAQEDSRPNPDPTALTTEQLYRALSAEREVIESRMAGLLSLHDEKFQSIQKQFMERDTRTDQTTRDGKDAIAAALQAAAMAVAKSETATTKQIDQQGELVREVSKGLNDKIDDAKARIGMLEGKREGAGASVLLIVAVIGGLVGIGGLVLAISSRQGPVVYAAPLEAKP